VNLPDMSPEGIEGWLEETFERADDQWRELRVQREFAEREHKTELNHGQRRFTAEAVRLMPELKDNKSERFQRMAWVLGEFPSMAGRPDAALAAMVHVLGMEAYEKIAKANGNGTANPHPEAAGGGATALPRRVPAAPVLPGITGAAPAAASGDGSQVDALRDKFFKSGQEVDRIAWMKATLAGAG
jgi:hypothetical protein